MFLRKYAPFIIGILLLLFILLIPSSRSIGWTKDKESMLQLPPAPVQNLFTENKESTLYVNVSLNPVVFGQMQSLNDKFMEHHANIHVYLTNYEQGGSLYDEWMAQQALGTGADIMLLDNGWVRLFAVSGLLKPTEGLLAGDALADQFPAVLDALKWNGYIWGVPLTLDPYILLWNKGLLAEANMIAPPDSFEQLRQLSEQIPLLQAGNHDLEQNYLTNIDAADLQHLLPLLAVFQEEEDRLLETKKWSIRQLQIADWLRENEEFVYNPSDKGSELLYQDRVLMTVMSWSQYAQMDDELQQTLFLDKHSIVYPWLNGTSFAVSSMTGFEQEALQWIGWMSSEVNSESKADKLKALPVTASAWSKARSSKQQDYKGIEWEELLSKKPTEHTSSRNNLDWMQQWTNWYKGWSQNAKLMIDQLNEEVLSNEIAPQHETALQAQAS